MFAETGRSDAKTPSLIGKGTQVGSEGAKAPSTSGRPQGVIWDLLEEAIEQAADLNR